MTAAATPPPAASNDVATALRADTGKAPDREQNSSQPDLARITLRQWAAAARTAPPVATRRRTPRSSRGDGGREPIGLGAAVGALATSHGWLDGLAEERVRGLWAELFPSLQDHAVAAGFDTQRRLLVLRPTTRAAAAHIRLHERQLLSVLAEAAGDQVRGLQVLLPDARNESGAGPSSQVHVPEDPSGPTSAPVPTKRPGSDEYLRTREALQTLRLPSAGDDEGSDPFAMTRNSLRVPEVPEPPQPSSAEVRRRQADRTHRLALARARAERREKAEAGV
ncbi:DciA family protein [Streptomyces sp. NPDC006692]|uniref:DciA family protein n=1 Tax=unclassified Streptomyces TaxID=2593676 RepID=UPI00342EE00C